MELELRLHSDDAARLLRLRAVAPDVRGRPRLQRRRLIWHDSPDQALARSDLVLAEDRGVWRLERLLPGDAAWLPGALPPVLERAASPAEFDLALPAPVAPVAGFDGRLASYPLEAEPGTATLGVLRGTLRSVADEQPVCRVLLTGEELAVRHFAIAIAQELRLEVPSASLAAEALALARGVAPPPRRLGPPALPQGLTVAGAFAYVLGHLTDVILHFASPAGDPHTGPVAVHQMRVAVRRLRSCFSVFRPVVKCDLAGAAETDLKALGTRLGPARDWDVFITETAPSIAAALPDDARLQRLLRAADRRRQNCHAELQAFLGGAEFRRLGIELAWLAGAQSWQAALDPAAQDALQAEVLPFAAEVLHRRLRKLLGAAKDIDMMALPALHAVRLRAKRMRYAAEAFASLYPGKAQRRFIARLSRLQQRLGELNDARIAATLMAELDGASGRHGYAVGVVTGFGAARAEASRDGVLAAWEKFRRQAPFWE